MSTTLKAITSLLEYEDFEIAYKDGNLPKYENLDAGCLYEELRLLLESADDLGKTMPNALLNTLASKMYVLDNDTLLSYLYLQLSNNLFNASFTSFKHTLSMIRLFDPDNLISQKTARNISMIHSELARNDNYFIVVKSYYLPWNDYIIPQIVNQNERRRRITDSASALPPIKRVRYNNANNADAINNVTLHEIIYNILYESSSKVPFGRFNQNKFLYDTQNVAVSINGTACSGKSTIIRAVLDVLLTLDENATILKSGKIGGFKGKDKNQILALEYQLGVNYMIQTFYTSISDRCVYNNLIWRVILAFMKTEECTAEKITRMIVDNVPMNIIRIMKQTPIIIFLDTDIVSNRTYMESRKSGTDIMRSKIEHYVAIQNAVYGAFAFLCDWPIFNTGFVKNDIKATNSKHMIIKNLIYEKTKLNIANHRGTLPKLFDLVHTKFSNSDYDDTIYTASRKLGIMK